MKTRKTWKLSGLFLLLATCYTAESENFPELAFLLERDSPSSKNCAQTYRNSILSTAGLIGYWPLDESSGTTGVNQVAGGLDFTYVSGVTLNVSGFAADGTSRGIATSSTFNQITTPGVATTQTDNITLEIWIAWDGVPGTGITLFYNGDTGSAGYGIFLAAGTGSLTVLMGGVNNTTTGYTPPVNQWAHIVVTRDNGTWRHFANGQELAVNGNPIPNPVSGSLLLAANSFPTEYFGGRLDDPAIYTVALSPARIASHYAAGCY